MIASQFTGTKRASLIAYPAGVCIQLFAAMIQKEDRSVPPATMIADAKCTKGGTRDRPKRRMLKNAASRKKAVKPS